MNFIKNFLNQDEHHWIKSHNTLTEHFINFWDIVFHRISIDKIQNKNIIFLYSHGILSCGLHTTRPSHTILVFPDLYNIMLSANYRCAWAILAHEIGHIILNHDSQNINNENREFQADQFCVQLGLKNELMIILQSFKNHPLCNQRLNMLS